MGSHANENFEYLENNIELFSNFSVYIKKCFVEKMLY